MNRWTETQKQLQKHETRIIETLAQETAEWIKKAKCDASWKGLASKKAARVHGDVVSAFGEVAGEYFADRVKIKANAHFISWVKKALS